jgi:CDP-glucose 4,6-dehydratase
MENVGMSPEHFPQPQFWRGRNVLLTGHTGFKGAWLSLLLNHLGARTTSVSLLPTITPNLFDAAQIHDVRGEGHICDIRDASGLMKIVRASGAEVILHLAAQAIVRESYSDPLGTFSSNIMGTANLLNAARDMPFLKGILVVTSDKVYKNLEHDTPYQENDRLGGHDPYSASKAATELVVDSMRSSFFGNRVSITTARAGNVIGGGDWSANRLLPDAVRAWASGQRLEVRNPNAVRPWQHVLEPLCAYLRIAEVQAMGQKVSNVYNIGPAAHEALPVKSVVEMAQKCFGRGDVTFLGNSSGPHEAGLLKLDSDLIKNELGIVPRWNINEAVGRTMNWYKGFYAGQDARALCMADIVAYLDKPS